MWEPRLSTMTQCINTCVISRENTTGEIKGEEKNVAESLESALLTHVGICWRLLPYVPHRAYDKRWRKTNVLILLFYIWVGIYWYAILYLKQLLFQGKDVFESPLKYLKDLRFVIVVLAVMGIAQATWLLDAWVREKLKLSQTYALTSLIVAPISAVVMFTTLWLSERHLGDKVVWWAAILIIVGTALNTVGGAFLLGAHK